MEKRLEGHEGPVLCLCAFAGRVASGGADNTVRVWSTKASACERVLEHHTAWVSSLACLPGTGELVSGSYDRLLALWDPERLVKLRSMRGHKGAVTCVRGFARGVVLSGSLDSTLQLWDTRSKRPSMVLAGHTKAVACAAALAETFVASGSRDSTVRLWDVRAARPLRDIAEHRDWVQTVLLLRHPDGSPLALSGSLDGSIVSWSPFSSSSSSSSSDVASTVSSSRARYTTIQAHQGGVERLLFCAQTNSVVSVGADGAVKQYAPTTLAERSACRGHAGGVTAAATVGNLLVTGGADRAVRVWDPARAVGRDYASAAGAARARTAAACRRTLTGHAAQVVDACQVDGTSFATCSWDGTVRLWELSQDFS